MEGLSTLDAGRLAEIREKAVQGRVVVDDEELLALLDLAAQAAQGPPPAPTPPRERHPTAGKDRDDMSETERVAALVRQAIHNSHDETYRFPEDAEEHVARVTRYILAPASAGDSGGERG